MNTAVRIAAAGAIALALATNSGLAGGEHGSKDEAVAMVKKAVAHIKADGAQKAYGDFTAKAADFHDRDLYVVVYSATGTCLAHGNNAKLVGKELLDAQDADGVYYIKKRVELMKTANNFWQDYKFSNPLTKKLEPKSTYCEKLADTAVCVGIYK